LDCSHNLRRETTIKLADKILINLIYNVMSFLAN
jgi:hypothetical protein